MQCGVLLMGLKLVLVSTCLAADPGADEPWKRIRSLFQVPDEFRGRTGSYRSPLLFSDGSRVRTAEEWERRRGELLREWHQLLGPWPPTLETPRFQVIREERNRGFLKRRVLVEVAPDQETEGWLLVPDGAEPHPAVLVPFYEPETSIGMGAQPHRDFARQLTLRGFVTLAIGTPAGDAREPDRGKVQCQPLSYYAYVAANCWTALAAMPEVDGNRIGIVGHSYGGKWALFAGALWERFAAVAVSDPGIVFDETRPNVNYWEPWYLGLDPNETRRRPGLPSPDNPRTGPYRRMIESHRDLHELHALIAPRPFFVSGGSEDPRERWIPLNHRIAVDQLLGVTGRVGMSNRPSHSPTPESNAQLMDFFEHFLQTRGTPGVGSLGVE